MAMLVCKLTFSCGNSDCIHFADCHAVRNRFAARAAFSPFFMVHTSDAGYLQVYCISWDQMGARAPFHEVPPLDG